MNKTEENKIILDLYEEYGFINKDISKFKEIVFCDVKNKMAIEDVEVLAKKNILKYLIKEIENGKFVKLFNACCEKNDPMKAFVLFDTILKEMDITISEENISTLAFDGRYKSFYDNYVNSKNKYNDTLLGDVLNAYDVSEEEISDDDIINNLSDDHVRDYFLEISDISVYTQAEEREIFEKYRETNNPEYKDEFIYHNLKLAAKIALSYWNSSLKMTRMDLIQEANMGLIRAFERFNPDRGFKFSTYATWWIRQRVTRALIEQNDTIRIPVHLSEKIKQKNKFARIYRDEFGVDPTDDEIIEALGWDIEFLKRIYDAEAIKNPSSMDKEIDNTEDRRGRESKLSQFLADENTVSVEDKVFGEIEREQLLSYMDECLTEREKYVICHRFGFNDDNEIKTLDQIGKSIGVTRERIRQIETKALNKLKTKARSLKNLEQRPLITKAPILSDEKKYQRDLYAIRLKKYNDKLKVVNYIQDDRFVIVRCLDCGQIFTSEPEDLLIQPECVFCSSQEKKLDKKNGRALTNYNTVLSERSNNTITALGFDKNSRRVNVKCSVCNETWNADQYNLLYNPECPNCNSLKRRKEKLEEIQEIINPYKLEIKEYINAKTKSTFKCLKCGYEWKELAYNLIRKPYCINCRGKRLVKDK